MTWAQVGATYSAPTASSRGAAQDIADLDHLLAQVKPGQQTLWCGDMGLSVAALQSYRQSLVARQHGKLRPQSTFDTAFKKWTNGNVPYTFDPNVPIGDYAILLTACHDWMNAANLHFYPRTNEVNYVVFTNSTNGNNSSVGMVGGAQIINIQDYQEFAIAHEVGHALGLMHEQQRSDRDTYVTINFQNIQSGYAFAFDIIPGSLNHRPYDFDSVMHYYLTAFSTNGQPTITINPPYNAQWNSSNVGIESHLSILDKAGMADIYGPTVSVSSTTRYVSPSGSDSNNGALATPFLTIQAGINASTTGDTLVVEDGIYTGPKNVDLTFGGRDMTLTSQNGPATTIINCGGSSAANHRGFVVQNGEIQAVIRGITIENGYESTDNGAGMLISDSNVSVQNCVFKNNTASNGNGGGVYNEVYHDHTGTVTLANCSVIQNTAANGGGLYSYNGGGSMTLIGCTAAGNMASNDGGGIYSFSDGGSIVLTDCTATGNTASGSGGGMYSYNGGGTITLTGCSAANNTTSSGSGGGFSNSSSSGPVVLTQCTATTNTAVYGGGISSYSNGGSIALTGCTATGNTAASNGSGGGLTNSSDSGTITLAECTALNNTAGYGGGLSNYSNGGSVALTGCTATGNIASNSGGGFTNSSDSGTITLTNCLSITNTAFYGGGIYGYNSGGTLILTNCTITNNTASYGGGFYSYGNVGFITLTNDILFNDTNGELLGSNVIVTYCDVQGGSLGIGNLTANPQFVKAPDDLHLQSTSSCLGKGTYTGAPTTTIDGKTRPNPPSIGAYETASSQTHVLWTNTNGAASLWNYIPSTGGFTQITYGPFAGWTAKAIADGGTDGKTRVLWDNANGSASLWSLDNTTGVYTHHEFGPYPAWTASAISVAANNTTHVLWTNTNGTASLWNYNADTGSFTQNTYGPYAGWSVKAIADGPDGKVRLLWDNVSGAASLWSLDNGMGIYTHHEFGPYPAWTASTVSVAANNTTHVLWKNTNGTVSLWNYNADTGSFTQNTYGPYTGWGAAGVTDSADGRSDLLWDNANGSASLWSLDNGTGVYTHHEFGPYPAWTATAITGG